MNRAALRGLLLAIAAGLLAVACAGTGSMTGAASRNDVERIDALVRKGFDVNKPEPGGALPLEYATRANHVAATERLLYHGADVDIRNKEGRTSLFHIARNGRPIAMARVLLDYNADANLADHFGMTPLLIAAMRGNEDVVDLLLAHGVDLEHRNSLGENALDLALQRDRQGIAAKLSQHGLTATSFPPLNKPDDAPHLPVVGCGSVVDSAVLGARFWCGVPYAEFGRETGILFGIERYKGMRTESIRVVDGTTTINEPRCPELNDPYSWGPGPWLSHRQSVLRRGTRVATVTFLFDGQRRLLGLRCENTPTGVVIAEGYSDIVY
ncbi:MAG: ankyrin repeat domain-containing protein [Pseudomonadota bacterium]